MKRFFAVLFVIAVLIIVMPIQPVYAQREMQVDDAPVIVIAQGKKKLTESEAAKRAQEQYGGKVVGVSCRENEDRVYCSVRLDIDGRIKTVTIRG